MLAAILVLALAEMVAGPANIGLTELSDGLDAAERVVLFHLRLPRLILAVLAVAG